MSLKNTRARRAMLTYAHEYAQRGWAVLPIHNTNDKGQCSCGKSNCPSPGKHPHTKHGVKDATTDQSLISEWWARWPDANIAVATGRNSGIFCLDVDVKNGANGDHSLLELESQFGPLPDTLSASTPSGGRHIIFQHNGTTVANRVGFRDGLDIKGDGGYILVDPSEIADSKYQWNNDDANATKAPEWLVDRLREPLDGSSIAPAATALRGVPEGQRNNAIFRYAAGCVGRGTPYDEAKVLVLDVAQNCNPPFPPDEAIRCLDSAYSRYPLQHRRPLTELGNAERFIDRYGNHVRYVPALNQWMMWSGIHWEFSTLGEIHQLAKATVRSILLEAHDCKDEDLRNKYTKHGRRSETNTQIRNMLSLASVEEGIPLLPGALDANDYLFGVGNGVINLKGRGHYDPNPDDYITKHGYVDFDPEAKCPRWQEFISSVTADDPALQKFLQRCVGYTMLGGNPEQVIIILYGTGANGKSTFLRIIQSLLGEYAKAVESSLFMTRKLNNSGGPREDIVRLKDARLILTTEVGEGECLDEDLVKRMTGDDTMTGRVPYGKSTIEFQPKFTPWMAVNHKPIIRGDDNAIWRRIALVPFDQTFSKLKQDRSLRHKLQKELPGILNWALEGLADYSKRGLSLPERVTTATREYRDEMDLLMEWMKERCERNAGKQETMKVLYRSYHDWCVSNDVDPIKRTTFGRKLQAKGFRERWVDGQRGRQGIAIRAKVIKPSSTQRVG